MKKTLVELLIVTALALVLAARGAVALFHHRLWIAPTHSKPFELTGTGADLTGLAYIGMAVSLWAVWFLIRTPWRKAGIALLVLALAGTLGAFVGAMSFF